LAPYGLGLGFYATDRAENDNRSIKYLKRTFNFYGKVNMAGRIYKVYADIPPETRCARQR